MIYLWTEGNVREKDNEKEKDRQAEIERKKERKRETFFPLVTNVGTCGRSFRLLLKEKIFERNFFSFLHQKVF